PAAPRPLAPAPLAPEPVAAPGAEAPIPVAPPGQVVVPSLDRLPERSAAAEQLPAPVARDASPDPGAPADVALESRTPDSSTDRSAAVTDTAPTPSAASPAPDAAPQADPTATDPAARPDVTAPRPLTAPATPGATPVPLPRDVPRPAPDLSLPSLPLTATTRKAPTLARPSGETPAQPDLTDLAPLAAPGASN
ncbi:hypothetical protein ACFHYO_08260, partial [Paracoccus panacisoli]